MADNNSLWRKVWGSIYQTGAKLLCDMCSAMTDQGTCRQISYLVAYVRAVSERKTDTDIENIWERRGRENGKQGYKY